jgi:hypothetical protein
VHNYVISYLVMYRRMEAKVRLGYSPAHFNVSLTRRTEILLYDSH